MTDDETREEAVEPRNEGPCGCPGEVRYRKALERIAKCPCALAVIYDAPCNQCVSCIARSALSPQVPHE